MKIIDTFVYFLLIIAGKPIFLIGILSPTLALEDDPNQKGLLLSILEVSHNQDTVNSNELTKQVKAVNKLLRASCEKNNGSKAYETAKKGWEFFLSCIDTEMNDLQPTTKEENFVIAIKKYCPVIATEKNCLRNLQTSIEPCLNTEERESMKFVDILMSSMQFLCDDDGARIKKFVAEDGVNCMRTQSLALLTCVNDQLPSNYNLSAILGGGGGEEETENKKSNIHTFLSEIKHCGNLEKLRRCVVSVFDECEHHTPADTVDAVFNLIKKEMNCESSNASASSVVNIIFLITISIGILTRF